ncbi:type II toxin-antitoxin system VapC family toxin [Ramlibacter sp.]|uniref:type II toxin-antitoxin system VapC family toxin n=1 Tax=Ramlibacter sp. TaxID=1917967 RepID=UPI003D0B00AE
MIALDTNVLARFYVEDRSDPEAQYQSAVARDIFAGGGALFIPVSVVLELEWVLRSLYRFDPSGFRDVVTHLAGLPNVTVESLSTVLAALDDHMKGLDFPDALHLRSSQLCDAFASFDDRKFARRATKLKLSPAVRVPA